MCIRDSNSIEGSGPQATAFDVNDEAPIHSIGSLSNQLSSSSGILAKRIGRMNAREANHLVADRFDSVTTISCEKQNEAEPLPTTIKWKTSCPLLGMDEKQHSSHSTTLQCNEV